MPGGSLYDFLRRRCRPLDAPQMVKFAMDVSRGMDYLHRKKIIHRDLKTLNLLIDANNVSILFVRRKTILKKNCMS